MTRRRLYRLLALGVAMTFIAAACGDDDDDTAGDETTETTAAPAEDTEATTTSAAEGAAEDQLGLADSDFGEILVDGNGLTLYKFDADEAAGFEPTCYDACADVWPPLLTTEGPSPGEGVDESLLGFVERTDGTSQVTYNDWPVYRYAEDTAPGDTNGQGVGGTWHVVGADGAPIRE